MAEGVVSGSKDCQMAFLDNSKDKQAERTSSLVEYRATTDGPPRESGPAFGVCRARESRHS